MDSRVTVEAAMWAWAVAAVAFAGWLAWKELHR